LARFCACLEIHVASYAQSALSAGPSILTRFPENGAGRQLRKSKRITGGYDGPKPFYCVRLRANVGMAFGPCRRPPKFQPIGRPFSKCAIRLRNISFV
jgi:hypothetical protein